MALRGLGKVTVAVNGTPSQLTVNQTTPTARFGAQVVRVQALTTNTGKVYIGASTLSKSTFVDVWGILPAPAVGQPDLMEFILRGTVAGFNAADFWIDVDNNGEGVIASIIEQ